MKLFIVLSISILIIRCQNGINQVEPIEEKQKNVRIEGNSVNANIEEKSIAAETKLIKNTCTDTSYNFLNHDSLYFWIGAIQGGSDSRLLVLGECFLNKYSYNVVLAPKNPTKEISDLLKARNFERDFNSFVFLTPMTRKPKSESEFDLFDFVYPSDVTCYKLIGNSWKCLGIKKITSFEDLAKYKSEMSRMDEETTNRPHN